MRTAWMMGALLVGAAVLVVGCGQKTSEGQPLEQEKAQVQTMSVDQLVEKAKAYKVRIAEVQQQLADLAAEAKKYLTDPLSEGAKKVAVQTKDATATLNELQERLQLYLDELAKKGQDATKLLAK